MNALRCSIRLGIVIIFILKKLSTARLLRPGYLLIELFLGVSLLGLVGLTLSELLSQQVLKRKNIDLEMKATSLASRVAEDSIAGKKVEKKQGQFTVTLIEQKAETPFGLPLIFTPYTGGNYRSMRLIVSWPDVYGNKRKLHYTFGYCHA